MKGRRSVNSNVGDPNSLADDAVEKENTKAPTDVHPRFIDELGRNCSKRRGLKRETVIVDQNVYSRKDLVSRFRDSHERFDANNGCRR
ncbi:hypothetical protein NECAME_10746 [Necator americanus]|uniref:Uncharacterized protein n=1 Tax=Necator americanus TaxID=51031 RepID=W2T9I1_NECAM|nr:hypothetical protein NECAME_10746 [Necator americanus]ETN77846.1 hypothetical protein NECAME_10746 [Necator americanus]